MNGQNALIPHANGTLSTGSEHFVPCADGTSLVSRDVIENQEEILNMLQEKGIAKVALEFAGGNCDGEITKVEGFNPQGEVVALDAYSGLAARDGSPLSIERVISNFAFELLQQSTGDLMHENDVHGTLLMDVKVGTMALRVRKESIEPVYRNRVSYPLSSLFDVKSHFGLVSVGINVAKENLPYLLKDLRIEGISKVVINYSGYGDEGCEMKICAIDSNDVVIDELPPRVTRALLPRNYRSALAAKLPEETLETNLEILANCIISQRHCEYKADLGGGGEIVLDVTNGMTTLTPFDNKLTYTFTDYLFMAPEEAKERDFFRERPVSKG